MSYLGSWKIDDLVTFYTNTHRVDTGNATDADAVPSYRVYEDETATPILTGNMALIDSANTAGFYSEQITLSAANGFEKGKCYAVYISATVNSITATTHHTLQIEAEVDANTVSDKTGFALSSTGVTAVWAEVMTGTTTAVGAMRGFIAALLGKASGLDLNAPVYRDVADTKNVISATTDANGNRSAVTLDLT